MTGRAAAPARKMREGDIVELRDEACSESAAGAVPTGPDCPGTPDELRENAPEDRLFPEDAARLIVRTAHLAAL